MAGQDLNAVCLRSIHHVPIQKSYKLYETVTVPNSKYCGFISGGFLPKLILAVV